MSEHDDEGYIGCFPKNDREEVRVSISKFKGHNLINARVYAQEYRRPEEWVPTKKGLSIKVELLPNLLVLLEKAHDRLVEQKKLPRPGE